MKLYRLNENLEFDPYEEYGGRKNYLKSLADDYGVPFSVVRDLSMVLGKDEDFDALVSEVEDYADAHFDDDIEDFEEGFGEPAQSLDRNKKRELQNIYSNIEFTLFSGSNADVADNIRTIFSDMGGDVTTYVSNPNYIRYDGNVNGYGISGSISRSSLNGDLCRLAEDLTMAYYRTVMNGKDFNTSSLMKAIKEICVKESYSAGIKITQKQRRELNRICYKYCGWRLPQEIASLWDELDRYGVDIGLISGPPESVADDGGKSWSKYFTLNGEQVLNSMFIYQVYEGNGDSLKNEYNIYFS